MKSGAQIKKRLTNVGGLSRSLGATRAILKRQLWIWPILGALVLGAAGWWVHQSVENAMRQEIAGQLTTILNADVEAILLWRKDQEAIARSVARTAGLSGA